MMNTTQDTIRKMVPQVLDREEVIRELAATWDLRPTGGTERERRAWKNGFRDAIAALGCAALTLDPTLPDAEYDRRYRARFDATDIVASEAMAPRGSDGEVEGILF